MLFLSQDVRNVDGSGMFAFRVLTLTLLRNGHSRLENRATISNSTTRQSIGAGSPNPFVSISLGRNPKRHGPHDTFQNSLKML